MAKVVVGAQFGDEGKGKTVDYFASQYKTSPLVIRFNGTSQAAHTVITNTVKHVFHHIGSGFLANADTYLSEYFVINPIIFAEEYLKLKPYLKSQKIYVDENCLITTPYDMLINQIAEIHRGNDRHGSCGMGFNETIERNLHKEFQLSISDKQNKYHTTLKAIKEEWVPYRLNQLEIDSIPLMYQDFLKNLGIITHYNKDMDLFFKKTVIISDCQIFKHRNVIFEGAQGLLLDQGNKNFFPYLTRSNTGIKNVLALNKQFQFDELDIYYVTRPYITRHGAGPLPHEVLYPPYEKIQDETNVHNPWQGSLRFGLLDLDLLIDAIYNDLSLSHLPQPHLVINCMDHITSKIKFFHNYRLHETTKEEFLSIIRSEIDLKSIIIGTGVSRQAMEVNRVK